MNYLKKFGFNIAYSAIVLCIFFFTDFLFSLYNQNYSISVQHQPVPNLLSYLLLLSFIPDKKVRNIFIFLTLGASTIQYLHFEYFGNYVQPISFHQFYFHFNEVVESFFPAIPRMILPIIIILFAIYLFKYFHEKWQFTNQLQSKYIYVILVLVFFYQSNRTYRMLNNETGKLWHAQTNRLYPLKNLHSADNFQRSLKFFVCGILPKKIFGSVESFEQLDEPQKINTPDANIILIVGESLRAKQLQVLGYNKETTPLLAQRNDLTLKTIYTAGTMTKTSVSALLNRVKYPGSTGQITSQKNALFRLAKKNGFKTFFMSAQSQLHLNILENYLSKKNIDVYLNRDHYSGKANPKYDDFLFEYLKEIDFSENNFIVFQQRGSHTPFKKQYPPSYKKFESHYDNTVLFTDYVLNELINRIQEKSKKPTYIIFTSDHGELVNEKGKNGHGWFEDEVLEVPFLYTSIHTDSNQYSNDLNHIKSHYDVSNLVASILGYDAPVEKDSSRTIYINGSDIDALSGYMKIEIKNGKTVSKQIIR